jgi:hypothetical protein
MGAKFDLVRFSDAFDSKLGGGVEKLVLGDHLRTGSRAVWVWGRSRGE